MSDVADQLALARTAHEDYRQNMPRRTPSGAGTAIAPGDPVAAKDALRRAYEARTAAESLDPPGADPAWQTDIWTGVHYSLLRFYQEQLAL